MPTLNGVDFSNIGSISGVSSFSKINNHSSGATGGYVPQTLGAISIMDFAKMYADGDYANGDAITSVEDKSGNGYNATAVVATTFDEDAFGTVGAAGYTTSSYFSTPASLKAYFDNADTRVAYTLQIQETTSNNSAIIGLRGFSQYDHHPYDTAGFYSSFSSQKRIANFSINFTSYNGVPKIFKFQNTSVTNTLLIRNLTDSIDILNSANTYDSFVEPPGIIYASDSFIAYKGVVGFIALFDKILTPSEETQLIDYLTTEYGL